MRPIEIILILIIAPFSENSIYIYNTKDIASAQFYDCIYLDDLLYCRRPTLPISLQREIREEQCYHNGTVHPFAHLSLKNISISTILHQWRSSIEKVEQYARYLKHPTESNGHLSHGTTFDETLTWQLEMRREYPWKVQMYGDIVCYTTLVCDYGLLCLDWRDICDGTQQCMSGFDEDNCDKLEFNECENDEYRCMNGMCIPQEYFLDGQFDCLDWSDEMQYYNDGNCTYEGVNSPCDDRMCPPNQWSCGDGQCILGRLNFLEAALFTTCESRRDQYYICEAHSMDRLWTLPNGRCILVDTYDELNLEESTDDKRCEIRLKCGYLGKVPGCPCGGFSPCFSQPNDTCSIETIQYPKGGLISPYLFFLYDRTLEWFEVSKMPSGIHINGTIKCRGFSVNIIATDLFEFLRTFRELEYFLCIAMQGRSVLENGGYDWDCNRESRIFNNRSYHFIDICSQSRECISAYRINDGFWNCVDWMDESLYSDLSNVCSSIQRYRFRCSIEQSTCLSVTALGNSVNDCNNTLDELWMGTNRKLSDMSCNRRSTDDCELLRRYIETSWSSSDIDQPALQLRMPFRAYCDTFWSLGSREDENANECRQWWNCSEEQWQCRNGQCIDIMWVLDGEWDCSDASDEEGALDVSKSHRNSKITQVDELQKRFDALNQIRTFPTICDLNVEFPCLRIDVFDPIANLDTHRPCIRIEQIGDGHVDCYGAIDERNTLKSCNQATMLGRHFKCSSSNDCVGYWQLCSYMHKCPNVSDDGFWCDYQHNLLSASGCAENWADFKCFNGICVRCGLCNRKVECSFGEDEYMCDYQSLTLLKSMPYRQEKELMVKNAPQKLRLYRFPSDANTTEPEANARRKMVTSKQTTRTYLHLNSSLTAYWCNRGVGVQMYNGSTICFCPPQYFGEKCQFHSDRILVLLHLNLSQSIYTAESDRTIVLKLLVLLLLKDEIVATHEFHVRPAMEMVAYKKKMVHFVYPRRHASVTDDHSYSIRIEGYELKMNEGPRMIAMWQYPVYFDFLPTFRLAKVLRFTQLGAEINREYNFWSVKYMKWSVKK